MVMVLPAMVADSVADGLFGGAFGRAGWADNVAATNRRLVQTNRRFMVVFSSGQSGFGWTAPTQRLSHRKAVLGNRGGRAVAGFRPVVRREANLEFLFWMFGHILWPQLRAVQKTQYPHSIAGNEIGGDIGCMGDD